jgi:hypothetical protein
MFDYLIRIDGSGTIDNTLQSREDLNLIEDSGLVIKGEYYRVVKVDYYFNVDTSTKVYIVDVEHVLFDELPQTIKTKMLWDR